MCDNCKQVRFELDRQWGNGQVDYPKLREMLSKADKADDE